MGAEDRSTEPGTVPVDKNGREIRPGSYIIYATTSGSSPQLNWALVKSVHRKDEEQSFYMHNRGCSHYFKVVRYDTWPRARKESTHHFPERMIVVDDIPPDIKRVINDRT